MQHYDVAIIGGGIGGLMSAYELATKAPGAKVVLFEKGHDIEKRACPIVTGKAPTCIKCPSCAIMEGLAGAGAFSDGKYVISTEYGGWLPDFLPPEQVLDYIEQADGILQHFGAPAERFMPNNELKKKCLEYDAGPAQASGNGRQFRDHAKNGGFSEGTCNHSDGYRRDRCRQSRSYCAL